MRNIHRKIYLLWQTHQLSDTFIIVHSFIISPETDPFQRSIAFHILLHILLKERHHFTERSIFTFLQKNILFILLSFSLFFAFALVSFFCVYCVASLLCVFDSSHTLSPPFIMSFCRLGCYHT